MEYHGQQIYHPVIFGHTCSLQLPFHLLCLPPICKSGSISIIYVVVCIVELKPRLDDATSLVNLIIL